MTRPAHVTGATPGFRPAVWWTALLASGFTLLELLVTMAVIAILASLLLSGLSSAKAKATRISCLSKLRQLQAAYLMYAEANQDVLPDNSVSSSEAGTYAWIKGNVQRYTARYLQDVTEGVLYNETQSPLTYRCPASRAFVRDFDGTPVPHNRSYAISVWLNCTHTRGPKRLSQIPDPARVAVFIEENAVSIDNGAIGVHPPPANNYWNLPASRHSQGCNLSFADGHAEYWHWTGPYLNRHNARWNADDTRRQRPDPAVNPTALCYSKTNDPDLIRLSRAVPVGE